MASREGFPIVVTDELVASQSHLTNSPTAVHEALNTPPSDTPVHVDIGTQDGTEQVPINVYGSEDGIAENVNKAGKAKGMPGRSTSWVWEHYTKVKVKGVPKAKCNYCDYHMSGNPSKGTSHLANHFKRCPRRKMKEVGQQVLQMQANFDKKKFELSPFDFKQEISRKELAKMIIMHEYPLSMVDHEGFRSFCNSLNPCFKMVSRNTVKADCRKIYEIERASLMQILEKTESRVAVTTDMWTSSTQKKGFMVVTAHFVDNSWKLQSRIISFIYVPSPHTSEVLCEALLKCLLDWNIDRKLSTITADNCATNDAMLNLIVDKLPIDSVLLGGRLVHMRCSAHILNLIVKDGLDIIGEAIEKVRDSVAYWSGTQKRSEKFDETARQLQIPIELFSGTKYSTANLFFPVICNIKVALRMWLSSGTVVIESMALSMSNKFEKYWSVVHGMMGVAAVFDPRYKCAILEFYFQKINPDNVEFEVERVVSLCRELVEQYEESERSKGGYDTSSSILNNATSDNAVSLSDFDLYASQKKRKHPARSELDHYLEEDVLPRASDFNVLEWWKLNKGKYPILHKIAKDILAIPVSTVASESAFSASGRLVGPHRSRLHPDTIETLMCAQSWLLKKSPGHEEKDKPQMTVFDDSEDELGWVMVEAPPGVDGI